ncbi:DMT family transporter [Rhizobiales bacterium L72]|uniref:DMT family transporter n=2 Tax=Propylenella binzhouense TaxID=2555902 RepID=A0A964T2X0_9HYPH|nr:DMT family transporter [Propylenella binzhouense]
MLAAMAAFLGNDTLVKLTAADLPVGQIIFLRSLFATPLLLAVGIIQGERLRHSRTLLHPSVALRTLGEIGSTSFYLSALAHLPIANATAILLLVPLATTAGASLFLGEPVGARRWAAIATGFLGALVIVRPGTAGFDHWSVLALVSVLFVTTRDLSSRLLPDRVPVFTVSALTSLATGCVGLLMRLGEDWQAVPAVDLVRIAGSAALLSAGYVLILRAMRSGDVAVVAPFRYSNMIWAIALQVVVFAAWPDTATLIGSAILVGTGLYTFHRERSRGKVKPASAALAGPSPE